MPTILSTHAFFLLIHPNVPNECSLVHSFGRLCLRSRPPPPRSAASGGRGVHGLLHVPGHPPPGRRQSASFNHGRQTPRACVGRRKGFAGLACKVRWVREGVVVASSILAIHSSGDVNNHLHCLAIAMRAKLSGGYRWAPRINIALEKHCSARPVAGQLKVAEKVDGTQPYTERPVAGVPRTFLRLRPSPHLPCTHRRLRQRA